MHRQGESPCGTAIPSTAHARPVVTDMEKLTGLEARRIHVDKGYCGHNHPHRLRVWISGQVHRVTASIRRESEASCGCRARHRPRQAEHRMDRNYLKGRVDERINAVLAAAGCNFGLLLRWLAELLRATPGLRPELSRLKKSLKSALVRVLHGGRYLWPVPEITDPSSS